MAVRQIRLTSEHHYGRRLPRHSGRVIDAVLELAPRATNMAFRRRSSGRRPLWMVQATDIRFIGHDGDDASNLYFEAPVFGDAAPQAFEQGELWPTRPDPHDTAFELLADMVADLSIGNRDSERFDRALLGRIVPLCGLFDGLFRALEICSERTTLAITPVLDANTVTTAQTFYDSTPASRRVKVYGTLDMVRASTQGFALVLPSGDEAQGVLGRGNICDQQGLLGKPIVVFGKAVYRPSGRLLRVDADKIEPGSVRDKFFGKIPPGVSSRAFRRKPVLASGKGGINAIFGKWPGTETDEQIAEALRRLS